MGWFLHQMQTLALAGFGPLEIPVSLFLQPFLVLSAGAMPDSSSMFLSLVVVDRLAGSSPLPATHYDQENNKQYWSYYRSLLLYPAKKCQPPGLCTKITTL